MKNLLLVIALIAVSLGTISAQQVSKREKDKVVAAFFDEERLREAEGQAQFENFQYYLKSVQEIVRKKYPEIEFKIVKRGDLLYLPDGTALNVQNVEPALGYVLSARGKKKQVLTGLQSDVDVSCAVAAYFRGSRCR